MLCVSIGAKWTKSKTATERPHIQTHIHTHNTLIRTHNKLNSSAALLATTDGISKLLETRILGFLFFLALFFSSSKKNLRIKLRKQHGNIMETRGSNFILSQVNDSSSSHIIFSFCSSCFPIIKRNIQTGEKHGKRRKKQIIYI